MYKQPSGRYSFKGEVLRRTEKAMLFSFDEHKNEAGDAALEAWLPISQCDFHPDGSQETEGEWGWVMVPEWLCRKLDILP